MPEVVYFLSCLVVGLLGRRYTGGFIVWFLLSALLTPIVIVLLLIVLAKPAHKVRKAES